MHPELNNSHDDATAHRGPFKYERDASPRNYPPRFGQKLLRLHGEFCSTRVFREVDPKVSPVPLKDFFMSLEWGDLWEDGNMVSVLAWLRGNKHLQLGVWRECFPQEL